MDRHPHWQSERREVREVQFEVSGPCHTNSDVMFVPKPFPIWVEWPGIPHTCGALAFLMTAAGEAEMYRRGYAKIQANKKWAVCEHMGRIIE